jgi:hypothetical protein
MNEKFDLVIHFDQACEQVNANVRKVTGLVKIKHLLPLITQLELEANPRDSRVGRVTNDIRESLERTPEMFPFKTKGILVAASKYQKGERNRYFVKFEDSAIEGILDGGHNTMAIGLHVLSLALGEEAPAVIRQIKIWSDFKTAWIDAQPQIAAFRAELTEDDVELDTLVPLELLVPNDVDDVSDVDEFLRSLLTICAARNNNAELRTEAKANQAGYFEALKEQIDSSISDRVEWRPNEGGSIKVADIVALTWIPLSMIADRYDDEDGRVVDPPSATQIYSSKGDCVSRFERLMSSPAVSETSAGNFKRDLRNPKVLSAFKLAADVVKLYDAIYEKFPSIYNSNDGKFGRITTVKKMNDKAKVKATKFGDKAVDWKYPEGFIVPLVYGLRSLIKVNPDGTLGWKTDPFAFVDKYLSEVVAKYKGVIEIVQHDPQKVGKANVAYTAAEDAFETAYLKSVAVTP